MRSCCCGSVCTDCLLSSFVGRLHWMETGQKKKKKKGQPPLAAGLGGTGWGLLGCPGPASHRPGLGSHVEAVLTETVEPGGCEPGVVEAAIGPSKE